MVWSMTASICSSVSSGVCVSIQSRTLCSRASPAEPRVFSATAVKKSVREANPERLIRRSSFCAVSFSILKWHATCFRFPFTVRSPICLDETGNAKRKTRFSLAFFLISGDFFDFLLGNRFYSLRV